MLCGGFRLRAWLVVASLVVSSFASQRDAPVDLDGRDMNPLTSDSSKIVVLVFVRRDCPVSGRYAPVIQKLSQQHADTAKFWLVFPDKVDSPGEIRKYLADFGYHLPAVRDPGHALVRLSRVEITPEVAVFARKEPKGERELVYDGRIDDWYIDLGRARATPTTHELEDALRGALDGKAMARNEVRGVGCYISDLN